LSHEATVLLNVLDEVDKYGFSTKYVMPWFEYSRPLPDWFLEKSEIGYRDMRFLYEDMARKIGDICKEAGVSCTIYLNVDPYRDPSEPTYIVHVARNGKIYTLYIVVEAPHWIRMIDEKKAFNAWVSIEYAFGREINPLE
jgi:hypothetical protein